jgi:hypothetical protein
MALTSKKLEKVRPSLPVSEVQKDNLVEAHLNN